MPRWTPPTTPSWCGAWPGATEARRGARYRCVLVYLPNPSAVPRVIEGVCIGRIIETPKGEGGFGYDPYFYSDELGLTFGEADPDEKDRVSHRGRALRQLAEELAEDSGRRRVLRRSACT